MIDVLFMENQSDIETDNTVDITFYEMQLEYGTPQKISTSTPSPTFLPSGYHLTKLEMHKLPFRLCNLQLNFLCFVFISLEWFLVELVDDCIRKAVSVSEEKPAFRRNKCVASPLASKVCSK